MHYRITYIENGTPKIHATFTHPEMAKKACDELARHINHTCFVEAVETVWTSQTLAEAIAEAQQATEQSRIAARFAPDV